MHSLYVKIVAVVSGHLKGHFTQKGAFFGRLVVPTLDNESLHNVREICKNMFDWLFDAQPPLVCLKKRHVLQKDDDKPRRCMIACSYDIIMTDTSLPIQPNLTFSNR